MRRLEPDEDDVSRAVQDPSPVTAPECVTFAPAADLRMVDMVEGGLPEEESTEESTTEEAPSEPEFSPLWILNDNVAPMRRGEGHFSVSLADMKIW